MSTVSASDVKLFVSLANPEKTNTGVDITEVVSKSLSAPSRPSITEIGGGYPSYGMEEEEEDDEEEEEEGEEEEYEGGEVDSDDDDDDEEPAGASQNYSAVRSAFGGGAAAPPPSFPPIVTQSARARSRVSSSSFENRVRSKLSSTSAYSSRAPPPPAPLAPTPPMSRNARDEESEEVLLEKQSTLLELERLKGQVTLSRVYTMDDRLEDMQFEVRRHLLNLDEQATVQFMRDGMRLLFTGIEIANSKLGPFLDLDGWAGEIGGEVHKYDSALSRMYRKYWRRSSMSPEMEIAVGVLGSMGMHHFKKKFTSKVMGGMGGGLAGLGGSSGGGGSKSFHGGGGKKAKRYESSDDEEGLPESFQ